MLKKINNALDWIIDFMAIVGRVLLITITTLVLIDVLSLNFFNYSFSWIFELNEYFLLFITFLGTTFVLKRDEHIKMDLVLNLLSNKIKRIMESINAFVGMVFSLIMTITGFLLTIKLFEQNIVTEAVLNIPRYLIIVIIPIGFTFLTIQFFRRFIMLLKNTNQ